MSKTSIIYRVETDDGDGPYYYDRKKMLLSFDVGHYEYLPEPSGDGLSEFTDNHRCGFSSKKSLLWWFRSKKCRIYLKNNGFKVYQYRVDKSKILRGRRQVAFIYDKSDRTGKTIELDTI